MVANRVAGARSAEVGTKEFSRDYQSFRESSNTLLKFRLDYFDFISMLLHLVSSVLFILLIEFRDIFETMFDELSSSHR